MSATIGPKIILEGEKEYRQAISDCNASMRTLKSEMKAVTAEFDGNANSIEALRKKNETLLKQQEEHEKKLKLLRGVLESTTKTYGENSRQAKKWQTQLNNAYADLQRINQELTKNEKYMKEAEVSTNKAAKSIDEFGKEIKEAADETKIFGDVLKANLASDLMQEGFRKLGNLLTVLIKDSKELASDLTEVQNVVDVTFGDRSREIDKWAEAIGEAFGLSELKGKQFIGSMGAMLKSMEVTDEQVVTMSKNLTELAADMASFYNADLDTVFNKIMSGISGQVMPLREFGINLNVANLEAYALAQGIEKTYNEMTQGEQAMLRYNYLLKVTADAQGDFARNLDSQANQERITQLQREEFLKRFGEAVLPAITRATMKFNEATKDMGEDLAEVAGIIADDIVDVLVWIIDNADVIIAGLKGISAALITKKSAEGAMYLVNAYKTLTTATQAATSAQVAFNAVSKANVYVALASAIIGVGTALFSYAKNAKDASDETGQLSENTQRLVDSSKAIREEISKRTDDWNNETKSIEAQYGAINTLTSKLYTLAEKEYKTNYEKQMMVTLVKQLNEELPELNLQINEQTWLLNKQKEEIEGVINKTKEYYLVQAAEKNYTKIAEERARAEIEIIALQDEKNMKVSQLLELRRQLVAIGGIEGREAEAWDPKKHKIDSLNESINRLKNDIGAVSSELFDWNKVFYDSEEAWRRNEEYIKRYSETLKGASVDLDTFGQKYKQALEEQTVMEVGTLEDRQKQINRIYDASSKELEKRLRDEERAFTKSQENRTEAVEKAQEKELKAAEKAYNKKLELINKEYLEKLKLTDEERYKELTAIQEDIDRIDNQQEAEDRAIQLREEAEKRAELKIRVESAKTAEERLDAQKELAKFEEKVARDRLKTERKLQKDILKEQKDAINKKYDEQKKAIENEQKEEQERLKKQYDAEKKLIDEKFKLRKKALKEELAIERDALRDKQAQYREYLKEQRQLAQENAKKIYEDELAQYKLTQALKYEETMSSEAQMKKAIQEYAYKHLSHGRERDAILRSNDLNEMLKYYNPSALIKTPTTKATQAGIDYDMMASVMKTALKSVKVELNGKYVGNFVESTVNKLIR